MHLNRMNPAWVLLAVIASISPLTADATDGLALEERIQYQSRIEQVYVEQRVASAPDAKKSFALEGAPTDVEIRAKVERHLKLANALERTWGRQIGGSDLQTEYERILAHSHDRAMLGRILDALDRDPEAVAACLVEPIVVRRAIHHSYWWDNEIHTELRRRAENELLSDDGAGGLDRFTGVRTETEWRLASEDEPLGMEYENGVQVRNLNRQQWNRLAEDLGSRWDAVSEPEEGHALLRFSPLEEEKEYLSASVILNQSPTHLRLATFTWWKRTFSDWWEEHAPEFSVAPVSPEVSITLEPVQRPGQSEPDLKEHTLTGDVWFSMNTNDPDTPSARDQHTVVWTGAGMIVWGGTNGTQVFSSGGIYDPTTDSWTATSQSGACPSARIGHSAVLRNNDTMVVWGGWNGTDYFANGSTYRPSTNVWTAMSNSGDVPEARYGHAARSSSNTMTIWGGRKATSLTSTGAAYGYEHGLWSEIPVGPDTPEARREMIALYESNWVIWGGVGISSNTLNTGAEFDAGSWTWEPTDTEDAPSHRYGHTAVLSGGVCAFAPQIFIWGGWTPYDTPYQTNTGGIFAYLYYGGWAGSTPTGPDAPAGRYDHTAVMDSARDLMIVWGGETDSGATASGAVLDICDESWTATNTSDLDCPSSRSEHTAVWTGKAMLVWGGSDSAVLGDGGVYTYCWGGPTDAATPTVADEDPCAASGIRVSWASQPTWNDYNVHRTVAILRDSVVIASDLDPDDGSYLDATAVEDTSYDYQVRFVNSCGLHSTSDVVDGTDESSSPPTVSTAPTAEDADGCYTSSGIDISWPANPDEWGDDGIGDRAYRVWRWQTPLDGWVALGSQIDYGTTSFSDPSPGFGKYRVNYINGCGKSTNSPETEMVYDLAGGVPTVTQTVATADADACSHTGNSITWPSDPDAWNDGDTGDRFYRVRRSTDGVNFSPIGSNLAYGTTSFVDSNANPDQEYTYQVRYKNGCELSTDSGNDTATDVDGDTPVTGFNASASDPDTCDDAGIVVTWQEDAAFWGDGDSGTRTYEIERSGVSIQTGIAYGTTSFTDDSGVNGVSYTYRVRMVNGCGLSAFSGISSSVADLPETPEITSTNNTAADVDDCTATGVLVTWPTDPDGGWGDDGSGAHTYQVLRNGSVIQSGIAYSTTEFTDTTGTADTEYAYTVRYLNCGGQYAETAGAAATDHEGAAPSVTTNSTAEDTDTCVDGGVTVTWEADPADWNDNDSGTRTYDVLRDGSAIQTGIAYGTTSFVDTTGDNGTAYSYKVRYNNGCALTATTSGDNGNDRPVAPAAPINNTAADIDACAATGVLITWNADPNGPWGDGSGFHTYDVLRDGAVLQAAVAYGTTSFTDTTGTPGTPYVYTVRYVNCGALHSETTGVTATDVNSTPATPPAPRVHDASACARDGVWVNWVPSAGAATYDLRIDSTTELNGITDPYLHDPGDELPHTFEIRANGASCPGSWSNSTSTADLIDPDAQFCDGFRTGDTGGWTSTTP